jgi:hypothetical protein
VPDVYHFSTNNSDFVRFVTHARFYTVYSVPLFAAAQLNHGKTHIWIGMNSKDSVGSGHVVNLVHTYVSITGSCVN